MTPGIGGDVGRAAQHDRDEPGRIGLEGQVGEVEQQPRPADEVGRVGNVLGRLDIDLGLGRLAQASSLASRCSSSRTLVKYSSSLSRSSEPKLGPQTTA